MDNVMRSHIIIANERTLMIMVVESEGDRDLAGWLNCRQF